MTVKLQGGTPRTTQITIVLQQVLQDAA